MEQNRKHGKSDRNQSFMGFVIMKGSWLPQPAKKGALIVSYGSYRTVIWLVGVTKVLSFFVVVAAQAFKTWGKKMNPI